MRSLIQKIAKLHHLKQIQILWITNAPIPDALSPDSENLAAAILAAIDSLGREANANDFQIAKIEISNNEVKP